MTDSQQFVAMAHVLILFALVCGIGSIIWVGVSK